MKAIIFYFVLITIVYSSPATRQQDQTSSITYLISEKTKGQYEIEYLSREVTVTAQESDIKFYFHSRNGPTDGTEVFANDSESVRSAGFAQEKPTLFIVHGWRNGFDAPVIETIAKASLDSQNINVFGVDWSVFASKTYLEAFSAVPDIGRLLGELMERLVANNGLNLARTTVVGHSLGAHVAGLACAQVGGDCNLVVGLDPAFPLFSYNRTDNRLDTSDAKFVHVIHTCGGFLGFYEPIGHADYYPNGGSVQPGCEQDVTGGCSHGRSFEYYAESLMTGNFVASKCGNYSDYESGGCTAQPESRLGQYHIDTNARGSYFLNTHNSTPYAMGDESWS